MAGAPPTPVCDPPDGRSAETGRRRGCRRHPFAPAEKAAPDCERGAGAAASQRQQDTDETDWGV